MSSLSDTSESTPPEGTPMPTMSPAPKRPLLSSLFHLPRNVYLLLFFTLGKGFQL